MPFKNVMEAAAVYDTIVISPATGMYGREKGVDGWFNTFLDFGNWDEHQFFKDRNEANVGLAYCNMQSADRMDYAFHAMSIGARFFGPITNLERENNTETAATNEYMSHFFQYDLPNHVSLTLRVGQDDQIDLTGAFAPPGYGPGGSGAAFGIDNITTINGQETGGIDKPPFSRPQSVFVGTQGIATKENRYNLVTAVKDPTTGDMIEQPLEIPRNETIEVKMKISEWARNVLTSSKGPWNYVFSRWDYGGEFEYTEVRNTFPVRYGITLSLYGVREVQQRGQYHAV